MGSAEDVALMRRAGKFPVLKRARDAFRRARIELESLDDGMFTPSESKAGVARATYQKKRARLAQLVEQCERQRKP